MLNAQTPSPAPTPAPKLTSAVYELEQLPGTPTAVGIRRPVFDGPTATVDNLHCHVTTLNPGASSGEPRRHLPDEIIILKDGTVEVHHDGQVRTAGPGSIIFFAAEAVTFLRNTGSSPATYYVISYSTPLTPKH